MKFKSLIFMLIFIFYSVISYGALIFEDSYDYSTAFTLNGYDSFTRTCPSLPNAPVSSIFTTNAFGLNDSSFCSDSQFSICKNLNSYITVGSIQFYGDVALTTNDTTSYVLSTISLRNDSCTAGTHIFDLYFLRNKYYTASGLTGFSSCDEWLPSSGYNITFYFNVDYSSKNYQVYINGFATNLSGYNISCSGILTTDSSISSVKSLSMTNQYKWKTYSYNIIDNIILQYDSSNITNVPIGYPCITNEDCISKKCILGTCYAKTANDACSSDDECLSGLCINGVCKKPSFSQSVFGAKNEIFGDDADTNNMLSLFISIVLPMLLLWFGHKSKLVVLSAVGIMIALMFYFTFIGWLNFFITFGVFIIIIIVFFILTIIGSGNTS